MDGLAKNNRDNVLFSSLLIGLSVDFCKGGTCTCVWCVCFCACVCACVYVCVIIKMFITKKSLTYFVNIHPVTYNKAIHVARGELTCILYYLFSGA